VAGPAAPRPGGAGSSSGARRRGHAREARTVPGSPARSAMPSASAGTATTWRMPSGILSGPLNGDFTVSACGQTRPGARHPGPGCSISGPGNDPDYMFLHDQRRERGPVSRSPRAAQAPSSRDHGTGQLPLNAWSLVTVTVSGTMGTLYVNGTAVGTNPDVTVHPSSLGTTHSGLDRPVRVRRRPLPSAPRSMTSTSTAGRLPRPRSPHWLPGSPAPASVADYQVRRDRGRHRDRLFR